MLSSSSYRFWLFSSSRCISANARFCSRIEQDTNIVTDSRSFSAAKCVTLRRSSVTSFFKFFTLMWWVVQGFTRLLYGWPVGEHPSFLVGIYENAARSPVGRRNRSKFRIKALPTACKPLILLGFHKSFNDTSTKKFPRWFVKNDVSSWEFSFACWWLLPIVWAIYDLNV